MSVLTAVAYFFLFITLFRTSNVLYCPAFCWYLIAMTINLIWHPSSIHQAIYIEPTLLTLRFCVVVEALALATSSVGVRERQYTILLFLVAGALAGLRTIGYIENWYWSMRQIVHVSLASACLLAVVYGVLEPRRWARQAHPHLWAVTLYMLIRAVVSFAKPRLMNDLYEIRIWTLAAFCVTIVIWSRYGLVLGHFKQAHSASKIRDLPA